MMVSHRGCTCRLLGRLLGAHSRRACSAIPPRSHHGIRCLDAVIFAGSGSTAAVQKFATILHLGLFSQSREGSYVCTFPGCQRRFADEGAVKVHEGGSVSDTRQCKACPVSVACMHTHSCASAVACPHPRGWRLRCPELAEGNLPQLAAAHDSAAAGASRANGAP